jgi:predicted transcriptional regulator
MTKQDLIKLAGSQTELAKILGISKPAVCQWIDVPELRLRQLKDLRPNGLWLTLFETRLGKD